MIHQPTADDALKELEPLIGEWTLEAAGSVLRSDVIDGVQAVFVAAAPLAALALAIVLLLPERPLKTRMGG